MWVNYLYGVLMLVYYLYVVLMWVGKFLCGYITISMFLVIFQLFIAYVGFPTHICLCGSMWVYVGYVGFRQIRIIGLTFFMGGIFGLIGRSFLCSGNWGVGHF